MMFKLKFNVKYDYLYQLGNGILTGSMVQQFCHLIGTGCIHLFREICLVKLCLSLFFSKPYFFPSWGWQGEFKFMQVFFMEK